MREARPWAKAIQEEVLRRRMPPWNAVKGFGQFQDDRGLTQEELSLIAEWVDGGAPEGNPLYLPDRPRAPDSPAPNSGAPDRFLRVHRARAARGGDRDSRHRRTRVRDAPGDCRSSGFQHRATGLGPQIEPRRPGCVLVPPAARVAGRDETASHARRRHGSAAGPIVYSYFSSPTGTSKYAVLTTPWRWNCTHTRCTTGRGKIMLNCTRGPPSARNG